MKHKRLNFVFVWRYWHLDIPVEFGGAGVKTHNLQCTLIIVIIGTCIISLDFNQMFFIIICNFNQHTVALIHLLK